MTTYSVYVFLDERNRPYYVGKTNNMTRRRKDHLYEIKTNNTLPKYAKARKLFGKGHPFKMRRIRTAKTEKRAFALERYYIKKYRKMGYVLMNCTHGGPDELPMRINNIKNPRTKGIVLPKNKKKKIVVKKKKKKINIKKKTKKVIKARRRR